MISKILKPVAGKAGNEEGQALIVAIIFLVALTFLGMGLIMLSSIEIHSSRNLRMAVKALGSAEEGMMVGMAYASDPTHDFTRTTQGAHVHLNSVADGFKSAKQQVQYDVDVWMEGDALVPPGWEMAYYGDFQPAVFKQILVQSTGYVIQPGETYDPANPPAAKNTVEIRTRIGSFGE